MQHFPVFLDLADRRVVVAGGGAAAVAKLRLLLKTPAAIEVYAEAADAEIAGWAAEGRLSLHRRALADGDAKGAALVYGAAEEAEEDARVAGIARAEGALVNIVDDLGGSDFITPAIVDRDPVTIAIGTEGAAPVLARQIKAELEERLPPSTGGLARLARGFRKAAELLPQGGARRAFWSEWFSKAGPRAWAEGGESGARTALDVLFARHLGRVRAPGHVDFLGAGPGDPELLTLKARKALDRADVVIHGPGVAAELLEIARREALIVEAGRLRAGVAQRLVQEVRKGRHVVRLVAGDARASGAVEEEADVLASAGLSHAVIPGVAADPLPLPRTAPALRAIA